MSHPFSFAVLRPVFAPIAMVAFLAIALAGMAHPSPSAGLVATMFPPWWSGARAFDAAARVGPVAAIGAVPFVLIVASDTPDSIRDLRRAGAWLVFDPRLMAICGASIKGEPKS